MDKVSDGPEVVEMKAAFSHWFEHRGVWPRVTYQEAFFAGYEALRAENERLQRELVLADGQTLDAEARIAELEKALEPFAKAPSHGVYGGPMVQAILIYEDSTDENTARHRGRIGPDAFRHARAVCEGKS